MLCLVSGNCLEPSTGAPLTVIPMTAISDYSFQNQSLTTGVLKEEGNCLKMLGRNCGSLTVLLNRSSCLPGRKLQQGVFEVIPSPRVIQTACQSSLLSFIQMALSFLFSTLSTERLNKEMNNGKKKGTSLLFHFFPLLSPISVEQNVTTLRCSGQTRLDPLQGVN